MLIIGLGNPDSKYKNTRHNAGFLFLDKLREELSPSSEFKFEKKFNAEVVKTKKFLLAKPQTFMNNSGEAVSAIINYYKIPNEKLIVIHDDLDIPLGEYRFQKDRSAAGHKGVESIIEHLKTQNFTRLRIGIKTEDLKTIPAENFVLQNFPEEEEKIIITTIKKALVEILPMLK